MRRTHGGFWQWLRRALCALCAALFVLSAAIALPILWRGFYYGQIDSLGLEESTGLSRQAICAAYDQVMDYLVWSAPFGTGQLAYSAQGAAHFADCRVLFRLDFAVAGVSGALLAALAIWSLASRRRPPTLGWSQYAARRARHLPVFWSAVGSCVVFAGLGAWGAVSFPSLFVAFHSVFFPGKTNWVFDPVQDEIITILPEAFFMRCALLIAAVVVAADLLFILADVLWRRRMP